MASLLAAGRDPVWLASPGPVADVGVAFEVLAADPVEVVSGADVTGLAAAWSEARRRWASDEPFLPVGLGFLSYDLGARAMGLGYLETLGPGDEELLPGACFRFYDACWRLGRGGSPEIWAVDAQAADRLASRLAGAGQTQPPGQNLLGPWRSLVTRAAYEARVAFLLEQIAAGEIYQANYARPLQAELRAASSLALAAALRSSAESPHAFWMSAREEGQPERWALVGNSPERLLYLDDRGGIETRPIKGTRPRHAEAEQDRAAASSLLASEKDRAEHVMIVDLERNDLGRICQVGSVAVSGLSRLMSLPTVHHLVSTVQGRLRPEVSLVEVLEAVFPGGSITGAPKHRAMSLIREVELAPRGPYTGATGWLGAAGDLDLAVAIRTAVVRGRDVQLWVGGGIVADSRPASEWDETEAKAAAFLRLAEAPEAGGESLGVGAAGE